MKAILDYYSPANISKVTKSGFRYFDTESVITYTKEIEAENEISLFKKFYGLNNELRYCNGSYFKFQDKTIEDKYMKWLNSDDFKQKSFNLFYGNGVVD